ncbi:MAG: hypothetical protein JSV84_00015 [Gemmatimonadota bacterium]|nr:MAG: hypothetical protein JSV84_00015 [Gemmatimonadota bacterium]
MRLNILVVKPMKEAKLVFQVRFPQEHEIQNRRRCDMGRLIVVMLSALLLIGAAVTVYGAVPQFMNFQGVLLDDEGEPVTIAVEIVFTIWDAEVEGNSLWTETRSVTPDANGIYNILLGAFEPITDDIFDGSERWLGVEVEGEEMPRTRLASVGYAYRVSTIDSASGGTIIGNLMLSDNGNLRAKLYSQGYGQIELRDFPDGDITVDLSAGISNGGKLILNQEDGTSGALLSGGSTTSGASLTLHNAQDVATVNFYADDGTQAEDVGALLTMYDGANKTVHIDAHGVTYGGAQVSLSENDGTTTISLDAQSGSDGGAHVSLRDSEERTTISLDAEEGSAGGGIVRMYDDDGDKTVHIDAHGVTYGGAQLSLSDHSGATTVSLDAESGASNGGARVTMTDGTQTTILMDANAGEGGAGVLLYNSNGEYTIELDADEGDDGVMRLFNDAGTATIVLDADYNGYSRVRTDVLEINGGSDLSEQFDIHTLPDDDQPSPGMVVCIDPEHAGKLVISREAYDCTVAGIISGAGGIKPGMLMGQSGSVSDGQYAVALTGRVYCWADASYGQIRPGDLLTTSDTPGHAMRVADHTKAQGAILGKAMTHLEEGQGLVLVLVTLQ